MRRINQNIIGQRQQLPVQAFIKQPRKLRGAINLERSGRPTSPRKSVSPVRTAQGGRLLFVRDNQAHALGRVSRRLKRSDRSPPTCN